MRRPLIAGNWKMNGSQEMARALLVNVRNQLAPCRSIDVAVFPPAPYLYLARELLSDSNVGYGAQDVSAHDDGAFTGDISVNMLQDLGCDYVIVGHSERRTYQSQSNALIAEKAQKALDAGLKAIVCVGESLAEFENEQTLEVIDMQLAPVLEMIDNTRALNLIIAYEPIWAIGTGKTATPDIAQDVHAAIRAQITAYNVKWGQSVRIIYGGSVKSENATGLFEMPDIDGALIGGASLHTKSFVEIAEQCNSLY